MTEEGLAKVLAVVAEEYGAAFSEVRLALWRVALADLSDEDGIRALALYVSRSHFPPHPADLIEAVRGNGPDADEALAAESEGAIRHMETHLSVYEAVNLGAMLNVVVREMGGPDEIFAQIASGDWRFRRGEAQRLYLALRRNGIPATKLTTPEWPATPRRINGPEDVPQIQHRVFEPTRAPGLPTGEKLLLKEGERG